MNVQPIEIDVDRDRRVPLTTDAATSGYADHRTPLIRDAWYVAALGREITRELMPRRLLGIDVAFYRTEAGEPVAVRNRCPHRSFPLAKGKVVGDTVVCGYHGMQFDPSGRCVNMPSMPNAPAHARVRSFELVERGPLVWIWLGHPDRADPQAVPDTSWLDSPAWRSVGGGFEIGGSYVAMHENLLDQTHFPFLHPGAIGTPAYARSPLKVRQEGEVVVIERELRGHPPPGVYGQPTGLSDKPVDRFSEARFVSPALHVAFARIEDPSTGKPFRFNITHLFTPATQDHLHYWWFNSRDFDLDNAATDAFLHEASDLAYREDKDALEWIMDVERHDTEPHLDLNFAPDKPGLLMRKALHAMAMRESGRVVD